MDLKRSTNMEWSHALNKQNISTNNNMCNLYHGLLLVEGMIITTKTDNEAKKVTLAIKKYEMESNFHKLSI